MLNLTAVLWLALAATLSGCIQDAPPFSQTDSGNEGPLRGATSTSGELDVGPSEGSDTTPVDLGQPKPSLDASQQSALDAHARPRPDAVAAVVPDARISQPDAIAQPDAFAKPDAGGFRPRDAGVLESRCVGQNCTCAQDDCNLSCGGRRCRRVCMAGVQNCRTSCFGPNCQQTCGEAASCSGRCEGPNCIMQCLEDSSCNYVCRGENCNFRCDDGHCDFDCQSGTGCVFDCREAESCNVRCRSPNCRLLCGDLDPAACRFDCQGGCEQSFDQD